MRDVELDRIKYRKLTAAFFYGLIIIATLLSVSILFVIITHIFINGIGALNLDFFTQIPKPYGEEGGGIAPAILGTLMMLAVAALIAIPIGVATAVFIVEYGATKLASAVRFAVELLADLPSIVVGIFIWALVVRNLTGYSGLAGSLALAVIMIPIIARSVEEILKLVPDTLREAALALGTPRWKVVLFIVIPTVLPGLLTSIMLAVARAAGETAPLLLTSLGNTFFNFDLRRPMAAMPLQIYSYAISPYDDWHKKAWGATLLLIALVGIISGAVKYFTRRWNHESH
ncbi:MAG: phosphate ABC transporter permease PstA [Treponema sp.]|nr:phosphate ABC transporter permease PstA [Treponema sp.]